MGTKTISITDEAYERLKARKKHKESFTDVINRLSEKKSLMDFHGAFSKKTIKEIEDSIKESRKRSRKRMERIRRELSDS